MKIIKDIIFSIVICLFTILAFEFSIRAYYYLRLGGYRYNIQKLVDMKIEGPYYYDQEKWGANELGFIGEGRLDPRKGNQYRILALGGSGVATSPGKTNWPDSLESCLNNLKLNKKVNVINGGVGGYTSSGEKKNLSKWIRLRPDLIIIYNSWNDIYYSRYLPEEYEEQFKIDDTYYRNVPAEKIKEKLYWNSILCRKISKIAKIVKGKIKRMRAKDISVKTEENKSNKLIPDALNVAEKADYQELENAEVFSASFQWFHEQKQRTINLNNPIDDNFSNSYRSNLRDMLELSSRINAKVILIQQPDCLYHYSENPDLFNEEDKNYILTSLIKHPGLRKDWINTTNALYPRAFEIMQEFKNEKNIVGIFDFNNVFDDYPSKRIFWTDSCHQTPAGRKIIGRRIANLILEKGLLVK